jgi:riboflavin kinase/FMN adenylyltransferase
MSIGSLSPEEFFCDILVNKMRAAHIVCGFNYTFGKNGAGGTELLSMLCKDAGIGLCTVSQVDECDMPVSASAIREAIMNGDTETAAKLLGRPFSIKGTVKEGNRLG